MANNAFKKNETKETIPENTKNNAQGTIEEKNTAEEQKNTTSGVAEGVVGEKGSDVDEDTAEDSSPPTKINSIKRNLLASATAVVATDYKKLAQDGELVTNDSRANFRNERRDTAAEPAAAGHADTWDALAPAPVTAADTWNTPADATWSAAIPSATPPADGAWTTDYT
ncbi:hypothetical protein G3M48_004181 [Beauveria asiatica]|uniref:Uncharacterized protein n=1 Tax=Beauveria asiatica TaxID=1069075 RepID=A0AAW0RUA8_9HYPO